MNECWRGRAVEKKKKKKRWNQDMCVACRPSIDEQSVSRTKQRIMSIMSIPVHTYLYYNQGLRHAAWNERRDDLQARPMVAFLLSVMFFDG